MFSLHAGLHLQHLLHRGLRRLRDTQSKIQVIVNSGVCIRGTTGVIPQNFGWLQVASYIFSYAKMEGSENYANKIAMAGRFPDEAYSPPPEKFAAVHGVAI